jgi:hypothetical protein
LLHRPVCGPLLAPRCQSLSQHQAGLTFAAPSLAPCRYDLSSLDAHQALAHEACRTFRDRLASDGAAARFDELLAGCLGKGQARGQGGASPAAGLLCSTLGVSVEERLGGGAVKLSR